MAELSCNSSWALFSLHIPLCCTPLGCAAKTRN